MMAALFTVAVFLGALLAGPIGWRIGWRAGTRQGIRDAADEFEHLADEAIELANSGTYPPTPSQIEAAVRRHPSNLAHTQHPRFEEWDAATKQYRDNIHYLRDRRDKIT